MTDHRERYDRIAEGYAAWWAPVHAPATLGLLDRVEDIVGTGVRDLLDVGCGTGMLAMEALGRWPEVRVTGVDASDGMLAVASRRAAERLAPDARGRLDLRRADADRLPFADATFDAVVSSFVFQLVPSRPRAIREARRVLRPGGTLAYVTWLAGGDPFAPDEAFDDALEAVGLEPREPADHPGDVPSQAAAVAQLRRAGFHEAHAEAAVLTHRFTPEGFLGFLAEFDEEDMFRGLPRRQRARLEAETLARLRAIAPEALVMRLPIVFARGRRPTRG